MHVRLLHVRSVLMPIFRYVLFAGAFVLGLLFASREIGRGQYIADG